MPADEPFACRLFLMSLGLTRKSYLGYHRDGGKTMLQFIEYPKCSTCRKAKAELNQLGVDFEAVDIVQNTPSRDQLLDWIQNSDFEIKAFFNTSGIKYRELGLKEKVPHLSAQEAADLLATDGMLIKRPLLVRDNQILQIGYRKAYQELGL